MERREESSITAKLGLIWARWKKCFHRKSIFIQILKLPQILMTSMVLVWQHSSYRLLQLDIDFTLLVMINVT